MSDQNVSLLDTLRQEEYTGENRCIPCTVVNVAIATLLAAVVATAAIELAIVLFAVSVLAIYFRGYLVPGTPTLTKRHLPDRVLEAFDKRPSRDGVEATVDDEQEWETLEKLDKYRENAVDPEQFLLDVGAVEPCNGGANLCYTTGFERRLDAELEALRVERTDRSPDGKDSAPESRGENFVVGAEALGEVFSTDPEDVRFQERDYPAAEVGRRIRKWPSDEALALDVATHAVLIERDSRWWDVPQKQRVEILRSLRSFRETCPGCGGPIVAGEELVESCCAQYEVISVGCVDCGAHLLELDPDKLDDDDGGFEP